jgi:hypothetical protein
MTAMCLPASDPIDEPATAADCDAVLAAAEAQAQADPEAAWYSPGFTRHRCNVYLTKFQPGPGKAAINCLLDPDKMVYDNIYTCGTVALNQTCRDPESVDALCKDLVDKVKAIAPDANKGGRLTRQCRTLMPGLTPSARTEVATCTPDLAQSFGADYAHYALYSCVEGL